MLRERIRAPPKRSKRYPWRGQAGEVVYPLAGLPTQHSSALRRLAHTTPRYVEMVNVAGAGRLQSSACVLRPTGAVLGSIAATGAPAPVSDAHPQRHKQLE